MSCTSSYFTYIMYYSSSYYDNVLFLSSYSGNFVIELHSSPFY